jgi:hypothetical protein
MKLRLVFGLCALLLVGLWPATAGADPFQGPPICAHAGKALYGKHHGNLIVSGSA